MKNLRKSIGLNVSVCLCLALTARADVVSDWNSIAIQAITTSVPPRPPGGSSFLDIAMCAQCGRSV
jgi:hypothetical protein